MIPNVELEDKSLFQDIMYDLEAIEEVDKQLECYVIS